jgi:hypothetical protein
MPHPDHHARRAAQSARSLAKLAAIAGGNGRRTMPAVRVATIDGVAQPPDDETRTPGVDPAHMRDAAPRR